MVVERTRAELFRLVALDHLEKLTPPVSVCTWLRGIAVEGNIYIMVLMAAES